jgi:hypothetical protein
VRTQLHEIVSRVLALAMMCFGRRGTVPFLIAKYLLGAPRLESIVVSDDNHFVRLPGAVSQPQSYLDAPSLSTRPSI